MSIVKANTTHVLYPQINGTDPTSSISNSEGTTASAVVPIVQGDKIKFRIYLTEYNYNTGVIKHGVSLAAGDSLTGIVRTSDDNTVLGVFGSFSQTEEITHLQQFYYISFSKDINNLVGKYFTLGRRVPSSSGYLREEERVEAFWFNDTGGTKATTAPSLPYDTHRIDIDTTSPPTNTADYPAVKAAVLIDSKPGFDQSSAENFAVISSTTHGKVEHVPTTNDTANIGLSIQQYGLDKVCYYEADFNLGGTATAVNTALGTADSITAKLVLKLNQSTGSYIKTIAQQDITIHRDFGS